MLWYARCWVCAMLGLAMLLVPAPSAGRTSALPILARFAAPCRSLPIPYRPLLLQNARAMRRRGAATAADDIGAANGSAQIHRSASRTVPSSSSAPLLRRLRAARRRPPSISSVRASRPGRTSAPWTLCAWTPRLFAPASARPHAKGRPRLVERTTPEALVPTATIHPPSWSNCASRAGTGEPTVR